jgi:hypothetical protein
MSNEVIIPFNHQEFQIQYRNARRRLFRRYHIGVGMKKKGNVGDILERYCTLYHPLRLWCRAYNIPVSIKYQLFPNSFVFIFQNPAHAILFKLKWV